MRIEFVILLVVLSLFLGAAMSYLLLSRDIRGLRAKLRAARNGNPEPKKTPEYTKRVIGICLLMGFLWVWCSYILAWLDHPQIAESLSQVAVTEIIGVVLAYCIKSGVENLSKHNHWPDKPAPPDDDDTEG